MFYFSQIKRTKFADYILFTDKLQPNIQHLLVLLFLEVVYLQFHKKWKASYKKVHCKCGELGADKNTLLRELFLIIVESINIFIRWQKY